MRGAAPVRAHAELLNSAELSVASGESDARAADKPIGVPSLGEAEFRAFYESTAPQLRGYLRRVLDDPGVADELLQESYLRLLSAARIPAEEAHRKNYLFRIATNLMRDHFRSARPSTPEIPEIVSRAGSPDEFVRRRELGQLLLELKPRERELLWLAYVEGYRHDEIAESLNCRTTSIRPMLFRARQRLARLLRERGWSRKSEGEGKP